jgi:ATP-dependent RNA helicase DDX21
MSSIKEVPKSDIKPHKRKRSLSGIECPTPPNEPDDFETYNIDKNIVERLKLKQIESLFEVQKKVYQPVYSGKNVIVSSLTGSGKTLAFVLPTLMRYIDKKELNQTHPKILVLAPTRELSIQTGREYSDLSTKNLPFKTVLIYGGVSMDDQIDKLRAGCDIIVGTPGRVIDMIERGHLKVDKINTIILDEADKMLDMGFEESITDIYSKITIVEKDKKRDVQVCLFSATIENWVRKVARKIMPKEDEIFIDLVKDLGNKTPKTVTHLAVNCIKSEKTTTIADLILCYGGRNKSTLVFVNTKRECSDLMISDKIKEEVQIIHGDINQAQREATLTAFRNGKVKCLVATDVASRGLDIPSVDLVIQSEPPKDIDSYIHRAGRTARAGRSGTCITLYTRYTECLLERIEQRAKIKIKRIGAPQKKDIIEASIRDTYKSLMTIDDSMIKLFSEDAKKLIEEFGTENAVARLLAFVSGHTKHMKSRSLLCGAEGWITYAIKWKNKFQHVGYVWGFFKRILKEEIKAKIRGLRIFASSDGCVFDFPEDDKELFEEILYNDKYYGTNYNLEIPDDLPELQSLEDQRNRDNNSNINNFTGGYRPNANRERNLSENKTNDKKIKLLDHSKYSKRKEKYDIFVGNMPYGIDEVELKEWFEKNGLKNIEFDARMVIDKETGNSRGFGFVSVFKKENVADVLKLNGKEFKHRKLIINESRK